MSKPLQTYYDGTKLLSLKDINGQPPEIYLCTSNRSAGKTTFFGRMVVRKFLKTGAKFALIYRWKSELKNCEEKFFKDIGTLFFEGFVMTSKKRDEGNYYELFIDHPSFDEAKSCGYAIALNKADAIKKLSHLLSDTQSMIFDEFQSETNSYCADEVQKLLSMHTSIARGQGKSVRYVPVYMLSNAVTLLNPYFTALGISTRLNPETKFMRGDGWVLEQGHNEAASTAQRESAFNRAFSRDRYVEYASSNAYLNDNNTFIEKLYGNARYLCTLRYKNKEYGIREFPEQGIIYCSDRSDISYPYKITVTTSDHDVNYVMLKRNDLFLQNLRWYFEKGCFRFKDLSSKEAVLTALSY